MKRPYDPHTINMVSWHGDPPVSGDELFNSRNRYQVLAIRALKGVSDGECAFKADCILLPKYEAPSGNRYPFHSVSKRPRNRV